MTSCGCVNVYVSDFYEDVANDIIVMKESFFDFTCCECGKEFENGDKYERYVGQMYDDEPKIYRTCMDCISIRDEFFCNGWIFTRILEDVENHVEDVGGDISAECLLRLTPRAREMIFDMIDEVFEMINNEGGE